MAFQIVRIVAVMALVVVAAALATPPGRIPLALRGIRRIMRRDRGLSAESQSSEALASRGRRILAFVLIVVALALAIF